MSRRHGGDRDGHVPPAEALPRRADRGQRRTDVDGPFAETKDLIAGWMVLEVRSFLSHEHLGE